MKVNDMPRFAALMNTLGELYGKEITEILGEVYWNALKRFEWLEIKQSVSKHIADPERGRFMPKPADIAYWMEGTGERKALLAWAEVMEAMRQVGSHESVIFDDLIIHAAIQAIGGWVKLGLTRTDQLPFVAQDFQKYYLAFLNDSSCTPPTHVVGMLPSGEPIRIGKLHVEPKMLAQSEPQNKDSLLDFSKEKIGQEK
jgi:hypothetical protein